MFWDKKARVPLSLFVREEVNDVFEYGANLRDIAKGKMSSIKPEVFVYQFIYSIMLVAGLSVRTASTFRLTALDAVRPVADKDAFAREHLLKWHARYDGVFQNAIGPDMLSAISFLAEDSLLDKPDRSPFCIAAGTLMTQVLLSKTKFYRQLNVLEDR